MTILYLSTVSSPSLSLSFSRRFPVSWTYSCEYFRYPTTPILTGIWREPLEPGVTPTTPDDGVSTQSKSLTRVSIYTSTHTQRGCAGLGCYKLPVYVYMQSYGLCIMHLCTKIFDLSRFICLSIHRVLVRPCVCTESICLRSVQAHEHRRSRCFAIACVHFWILPAERDNVFFCLLRHQIQKQMKTALCEPDMDQISLKTSFGTIYIMSTLITVKERQTLAFCKHPELLFQKQMLSTPIWQTPSIWILL